MSTSLGPNLGLLVNANIGDAYYDQLRPFLRAIDALLQGSVINATTVTPPASPNNGDAYLLATGTPTRAWAGQFNSIAVWSTEITQAGTNTKVPGWDFYPARPGGAVWNMDTSAFTVYENGAWRDLLYDVPTLSNNNNWVGGQGFEGGLQSTGVALQQMGSADSSTNYGSYPAKWEGSFFNGTEANADQWSAQSQIAAGSPNPSTTLVFSHSGTAGAAVVQFPSVSLATATTATSGAATALPATPLGYLEMSVNGTTVKFPYYG